MFFNPNNTTKSILGEDLENPNAYTEALIFSEAAALPQEERKAFIESEEAKVLLEKKLLSRKTLVRLSKQDDLARRVKMAAFQIAKQKKDQLWAKLVKNRVIERQLIRKIVQKYQNQAVRLAKQGQRDYVKAATGSKFLPKPEPTKQ